MTTKLFKEVWIKINPRFAINSSKLKFVELNNKKILWKFIDDSGFETETKSKGEALFKFEHLTKFLEAQDLDDQAEKKWEEHQSWELYADRSDDDPKPSPDPKTPSSEKQDMFFKENGKNEFNCERNVQK